MKLKSFFAGSVEEALSDARREFGPEAVLVQSRRTSPDARDLGEYEVVCALLPEDEGASVPSPAAAERSAKEQGASADARRLAGELAELKHCMQRLQTSIVLAGAASAAPGTPVQVREALASLLASEVEADLAQQIVGAAGTHAAGQSANEDFIPGNGVRFSALVHRHVMRLAATRASLGEENATRPRAVALVGPPGAGKTSCIAKLAARYAIAMHRGAHVVAMDEYRIGGSEQLRAYTAILGVGFDALTHDASLSRVIEERRRDLILVDVPGFSRSEMDLAGQVARRLHAEEVEVQLVLPASLRAADLRRIAENFAVFKPAGLIFTRLDETDTYGPLLNEIVRTGKPASFLSNGPHVPDDIEPATRARIADLVLSGAPGGARMSWAAA
jgi:flagellar biosynthesis protein FlhF